MRLKRTGFVSIETCGACIESLVGCVSQGLRLAQK